MKKICVILSIALLALTACQQIPKPVTVNVEAERAAVDTLINNLMSAFGSQDTTRLVSYLTDDVLCMGSDPSELWNKKQITELWTQMLADSAPEIIYISKRVIKVNPDGNSGIAVEQYLMPAYSTKIPWRNVYQVIKTDNKWMINFFSSSFIPKNEDYPKLNASLEE